MVSEPHQGGVRLQRGGSRRHLRGRTALQADTKGVATIRGGGVAPDYSQYSLPGWIVLLCPGLCARYAFSPFAAPAAIFAGVQPSRLILRELPLSGGVAPGYSQYSLPGYNPPSVSSSLCLFVSLSLRLFDS